MSQRAARKSESRERILEAAARLVREEGIEGTGVDRSMRAAGLTAGAFYAHFQSKSQLLSLAFERALEEIGAIMRGAAAGESGPGALMRIADTYLSEEHMRKPAAGCPLPAVAGEAASTKNRAVHQLLARGLETVGGRLQAAGDIDADRALGLAALLVGGQILARATRGTPVAARVLAACRTSARRMVEDR